MLSLSESNSTSKILISPNILKTSDGICALQTTLEGKGILIDCPNANTHHLDFGVTCDDTLPADSTVVLETQGCNDESVLIVIETIFIGEEITIVIISTALSARVPAFEAKVRCSRVDYNIW